MKDVLLFAILGLGAGAAYALIALGIVLIQKGSGAVNFAQGAIAGCAALFFTAATNNGMSQGARAPDRARRRRACSERSSTRSSCARCGRRRCWRASSARSA